MADMQIAGFKVDPFSTKMRPAKPKALASVLVEDYLALGNGLTLTADDADLLTRLTTTPPRDRTQSFSGSARGSCERAQVFQYLGTDDESEEGDVDVKLQSVFLDGTWRHLRWQMLLLAAGREFNVPVQVEVPFRSDTLRLRGSLDGIIDGRGFELKGTRAMHAALKAPFASHVLQVHSYMVLADLDIFSVVYEDKATQETVEHVVMRDDTIERKVREELARLNEAIDTRVLPPIKKGCQGKPYSQEWWDCPYNRVCAKHDFDTAEGA